MNERNCYLIIDKVDNGYRQTAHYAIVPLLLELKAEIQQSISAQILTWCMEYRSNPFVLDMIYLTEDDAKKRVEELKTRNGIHCRIQYHKIENKLSTASSSPLTISKKEILSDSNKLNQYLKDLYILEKQLYCSEQARNEANKIANQLGIPADIQISGNKVTTTRKIFDAIFVGISKGIGGLFIGIIIGLLLESISHSSELAIIGIIISTLIGFWLGISDANFHNNSTNQDYERSMAKLEKDNQRVEKEKALIPIYREQEELFAQNIASCRELLNQLYSIDVIFPKYRNFIAISQIYEYFMSGRCTQLQGHKGAYNIFENEIRQDIIITQLNIVIDNLEEIKNTQYMIYEAIKESNRLLGVIANNTSVIAYNTAVMSENTSIQNRYCY